MKQYFYPKLSRIDLGLLRLGGPGLGNLLFPISRALIDANKKNGIFVEPTIRQLKLGPLLRREDDLRIYSSEFKARDVKEYLKRLKILGLSKANETDSYETKLKKRVIEYSGLGNYFLDLKGSEELILNYLQSRARICIMEENSVIRAHIRQGDFSEENSQTTETSHSVRIKLEWYRNAIETAKRNASQNSKIIIHTDGDKNIISESLKGLNYIYESEKSALANILLLSKCDSLICSRSTFSLWGAFLGKGQVYLPKKFNINTTIALDNDRIIRV